MSAPTHLPAPDREAWILASLWRTLPAGSHWRIGFYVLLSGGSALAGSMAALLFVPLLQPGQPWRFAGMLPWLGSTALHDASVQALAFVAGTTLFAVLRWQASCVGARLVAGYGVALRQRVHAHLLAAPLRSLSAAPSAEIANVLTYNVEIVVQAFSAFQQLLVAGLTAAVSLAFAFAVSPVLMLASPLLVLVAWLATRLAGREQVAVGRRYVADMTSLFWHSEDFPRRLRHVRSFGREAAERASYAGTSARLGEGYARQLTLIATGRLTLELVATAALAVVFVLARRWHLLDTPSLVAVCLLLGRLLPHLVNTRQGVQQLRSAGPAFALWRRYAEWPGERQPKAEDAPGRKGVRIVRLRVTPPAGGVEVCDLNLAPGQLLLVQGDSGIGKSSVVDALAGMVPPDVFEARLGGAAVTFEAWRAHVRKGAYVSQGVRPWQATVAACLRWAAPDATDPMLRDVLKDVGLDKPLDATLDGPAGRLSGGELQRLLLGQVILRRPVLAVLDEATSALDAGAELAVLAMLRQRLPHTMLVVVSHRPAVEALADATLVFGSDRRTEVRVHSRWQGQLG